VQALDTNVVVRLVLGDDFEQAARAVDCWKSAFEKGGIYLSQVVLVEMVWVLSVSAQLGRDRIVNELHRLTSMDGVVIENESAVDQAIECYERSSADFADCLILAVAREANALPVHTFDRRFSRETDVQLIEMTTEEQ